MFLYVNVYFHLKIILNYQQFLEIWPNLFAIFETVNRINPPDLTISLSSHWKYHPNFTDSKIYGINGELIGSENCYFILPCNQNGFPINPPTILLKE